MTTPTKIAVVIATCNRTHLMKTRALPSIAAQSRNPDFLIVVDDSIPSTRQANAKLLSSLSLRNCTVVYRENARTAGASGAWNTALEYLLEEVSDVHNLFVASVANSSVDNNEIERLIKMIVRVRKNSLFFKTQNGADVSDVITSVLATCTECGANAFDYLHCLQRNQLAVKAAPEKWLPWNYPVGK